MTPEKRRYEVRLSYFWNVALRACPCPPLDTEDKLNTQTGMGPSGGGQGFTGGCFFHVVPAAGKEWGVRRLYPWKGHPSGLALVRRHSPHCV